MIYVLNHMDSDGRFGAYCAFCALKDQNPKFIEVQYGKPFPIDIETLTKEDTVYIIDFSYKKDILNTVYEKVGKLVVLDHHKSAMEELQGLPYALFDITKSGALLAWEHFNPGAPAPRVCQYVNDRDLWTKQFIESTYLESYLRFRKVGLDWKEWDNLVHFDQYLEKAISTGRLVWEVEDSLIRRVFFSRRHHINTSKFSGLKTVIYNCPGIMHSEIAEMYYTSLDVDATIGWRIIDNGQTVLFNLRSPGRTDVSVIAKAIEAMPGGLSGGGHAAAAGATMRLTEGLEFIRSVSTS